MTHDQSQDQGNQLFKRNQPQKFDYENPERTIPIKKMNSRDSGLLDKSRDYSNPEEIIDSSNHVNDRSNLLAATDNGDATHNQGSSQE